MTGIRSSGKSRACLHRGRTAQERRSQSWHSSAEEVLQNLKARSRVIDIESSAVLFAYNVKKGNFQSAAEAFAKHLHNDYLKQRCSAVPVFPLIRRTPHRGQPSRTGSARYNGQFGRRHTPPQLVQRLGHSEGLPLASSLSLYRERGPRTGCVGRFGCERSAARIAEIATSSRINRVDGARSTLAACRHLD